MGMTKGMTILWITEKCFLLDFEQQQTNAMNEKKNNEKVKWKCTTTKVFLKETPK